MTIPFEPQAVDTTPREVELKLFVPPSSVDRVWSHPLLVEYGVGPIRASRVDNRYFDTADRALAQQHMALRVRRIGRRWLQTLKVAKAGEGAMSTRGEWEMPIAGPVLQLGLLKDTPLATIGSPRRLSADLQPIFTTNFRRESRMLRLPDGSEVEFVFDTGTIAAGRGRTRRTLPICEVEIEVVRVAGESPDLLRFAARLVRDLPLIPLPASKAERGHRVAEQREIAPVRVVLPVPQAADDARVHLGRTLGACNDALLRNAHALFEVPEDERGEFVHQARVALRRLRSALRTFRPIANGRRFAALNDALRDIGRTLGIPRDWDVLLVDTAKRLDDVVGRDDEGRAALATVREQAALRREAGFRSLMDALDRGAFGATTIAVERRIARLASPRGAQASLGDLAPTWLSDQSDRVVRLSRRIAVLDTEQRHGLRIEVKRLRYALDLLEGLYDAKAVATFRDALAELQQKLGMLNDETVGLGLIRSLDPSPARDLVVARFGAWIDRQVLKQLPKVAALSVALELTPRPWVVAEPKTDWLGLPLS